MPVRFTPASANSKITADGAVQVQCESVGDVPTIVPLLIFSESVERLRVDGASLPGDPKLQPLSSRQQLIAVAGTGDQLGSKLFPGDAIVTVHVPPLDPMPGPALAWQTLDALILDGPWPGAFDVEKLPDLLAGGTEVAVHSKDRPDGVLPWESIEGGWVLRRFIAGPIGCDGNPEAYAPVDSWEPDLPGSVRLQIVLAAVLFSVALLGTFLLPRKGSVLAVSLLVLATVGVVALWRKATPVVYRGKGNVIVHSRAQLQTDQWQIFTARETAAAEYDVAKESWPIFADATHAAVSDVVLHWKDGLGRFTFQLHPGAKLAFVSRILSSAMDSPTFAESDQSNSPMAGIGRALYLQKLQRETFEKGEKWNRDDASPLWPAVHIWTGY